VALANKAHATEPQILDDIERYDGGGGRGGGGDGGLEEEGQELEINAGSKGEGLTLNFGFG
jgi:hypothetical protein